MTKVNYANAFREYVRENFNRDLEETNAIWFTENNGCYPQGYIGEELLIDIMNKFYEPLDFIVAQVSAKLELSDCDFLIVVMPSFEGHTYYIVTYKDELVLEHDAWKAWNFWFRTNKEFNEWIKTAINMWSEKIGKMS